MCECVWPPPPILPSGCTFVVDRQRMRTGRKDSLRYFPLRRRLFGEAKRSLSSPFSTPFFLQKQIVHKLWKTNMGEMGGWERREGALMATAALLAFLPAYQRISTFVLRRLPLQSCAVKRNCFAKHQPDVAGCGWLQQGRNFLST